MSTETIRGTFSIPSIALNATAADRIILKVGIKSGFGVTGATKLDELSDVDTAGASNGQVLAKSASGWTPTTVATGITDHGVLSGLNDDDHTQYFNQSRGDARYYPRSEVDTALAGKTATNDPRLSDARTPTAHVHTEADITDLDKYTVSEVNAMIATLNTLLASKAATNHAHTESDITDLDKYSQSQVDNLLSSKTDTNDPRLSNARTPTAHSHTKSQITDFDDSDYATSAQGAKADTALQSLPANVVLDGDSRLSDARTPTAHSHTKSQITDFNDADYATAAQGAKADTALQSLPANAVVEDDARLTDARTPTAHNHTESDITDLDKYSQSQVDGLVATRAIRDGAETLTGNKTFSDGVNVGGDMTISGNLTIAGTGTTSIGNEVQTGDNKILLNADEAGTPSLDIGLEGERGTDTNVLLQWNEAIDRWEAGLVGAMQAIVLGNDARLSDARTPTTHSHTKSEISDFNDADYATAAQGAKADTALQSLPTHSHTKAQITDFDDSDYATAAQGAKADTALQALPANAIVEGDARLTNARTPTAHGHTKSEITDFSDSDYATAAQGAKADSALQSVALADITDVDLTGAANGHALVFNGSTWVALAISSGTTDHGSMSGLDDDDHTQYHNNVRGDVRYYLKAAVDTMLGAKADQLTTYTKSEVDGIATGKEPSFTKNTAFNKAFGTIAGTVAEGNDARLSDARTPTAHTHTKSQISDFSDADYATAAQGTKADSALQDISAQSLADLSDVSGTATTDQVLAWNGSGWTPSTISGSAFNGGTITENLEIDKADANMLIDATTGTTPRVTVQREGVKTFEIQGLQTRSLLRRYHETGGGQNRFEMYDDSSRFDHEVRGIATTAGSDDLSFTTKAYVDAIIVGGFNGGTITDNLTIEKANAKLDIKSTGDTNPTFNLWYNGTAVQQMYFIPGNGSTTDHIRWVKTGGIGTGRENTLRLFSGYGQVEADWRLTSVASDADAPALQLFEHVDNGFNHVDIAAPDSVASTYRVVMPASPGVVGQGLTIGSVSGTTLNLVWS